MRLSDSTWRTQLEKLLAREHDVYSWRIPCGAPVRFKMVGRSLEDNLALRDSLHRTWKKRPERRLEIATWYVRRWGGVTKNKQETIKSFVDALGNGELPSCMSGVASWSKIAAISDPSRWAIFDARVAFSLNALQHIERGRVSEAFPLLPSRNTLVRRALVPLRLANNLRVPMSNDNTARYLRYLQILRMSKRGLQRMEMALFSAAERLARDVLSSQS